MRISASLRCFDQATNGTEYLETAHRLHSSDYCNLDDHISRCLQSLDHVLILSPLYGEDPRGSMFSLVLRREWATRTFYQTMARG